MVNHHFGNLPDVWKHLALTEVLAIERPTHYAETHAGSAVNAMRDDVERRFGVGRFVGVADSIRDLAASEYRKVLGRFGDARLQHPGSPALATTVLGRDCRYLFCDQDPASAADLAAWTADSGAEGASVARVDGMSRTVAWLGTLECEDRGASRAVVHVDPFDPYARQSGGKSALEVAADIAEAGHGLVYWYGYDVPADAHWALHALCTTGRAQLWSGDLLVTRSTAETTDGFGDDAGTGPTGIAPSSGIVLANVTDATRAACERLGRALEAAYADLTLEDGAPAHVRFDARHEPG